MEPSEPVQACNGIALPLPSCIICRPCELSVKEYLYIFSHESLSEKRTMTFVMRREPINEHTKITANCKAQDFPEESGVISSIYGNVLCNLAEQFFAFTITPILWLRENSVPDPRNLIISDKF